jgi:hypothetical protein
VRRSALRGFFRSRSAGPAVRRTALEPRRAIRKLPCIRQEGNAMDDATTEAPGEIALWNPNAAALWSLLFTPMFGAYIHALNWRALGDKEQEEASLTWVFGAGAMVLLMLLVEILVPKAYNRGDSVSHTIEFAFLLAWYFLSARPQAKLVKERFGGSFKRKPWRQPLLMGLAGFGIYIVLMIAIGIEIGIRNL